MSPIPDTSLISQVGESIDAARVIALPDPSKVKAGDTVTLNIDPSPMEVPYRPYSVRGEVYPIGASLFAGGWPIIGHPSVTLADHKPAPEPEPEWKPGTVVFGHRAGLPIKVSGDLSIPMCRGDQMRLVRNTTNDGWYDFADVRDGEPRCYTDAEITNLLPVVEVPLHRVDVHELATHNGLRDDSVRQLLADLGIGAS